MSTELAMNTIRLWKSGRHGTAIGHAAVQQILNGVYNEPIEDVMKSTPILGIKSAIQALHQLWHLLEAEADNFKRNGCVFKGTHLSKQDCYIVANMVPTMISHELGQAAFLGDGSGPITSSAAASSALRATRKRSFDDSDDDEEDYRRKRRRFSSWPSDNINPARKRSIDDSDEEEEYSRKRRFSSWPSDKINPARKQSIDDSDEEGEHSRKRRRFSPWPGENTRQSIFRSSRPSLKPWPEDEVHSIQAGKRSVHDLDDDEEDRSQKRKRFSPSPDLLQEDCKQEDDDFPSLSQIPHISEK